MPKSSWTSCSKRFDVCVWSKSCDPKLMYLKSHDWSCDHCISALICVCIYVQVKFGQHKRYQDWFQKKVLVTFYKWVPCCQRIFILSSCWCFSYWLVSLHTWEPASDSRDGSLHLLHYPSHQRDPRLRHYATLGSDWLASVIVSGDLNNPSHYIVVTVFLFLFSSGKLRKLWAIARKFGLSGEGFCE